MFVLSVEWLAWGVPSESFVITSSIFKSLHNGTTSDEGIELIAMHHDVDGLDATCVV